MFCAAGRFASLSPAERAKFHDFMGDLYRSTTHDSKDQDAAGFYSWCGDRRHHDRSGEDKRHLIRTSKEWASLEFNPAMLYLCHARGAFSDPTDPNNNHPFVGENVALMHEGWISNHKVRAATRRLSLTTETDSELYMRLADQRRPPLGDREEWDAVECMSAMLQLTGEPTALAFIDHSSQRPHIWFGINNTAEHPFGFYRIRRFKGTFLVSTPEMMKIAGAVAFAHPTDAIERIEMDVEPFHIYKMDGLHDNITVFHPTKSA
jgi:hypothetical protein